MFFASLIKCIIFFIISILGRVYFINNIKKNKNIFKNDYIYNMENKIHNYSKVLKTITILLSGCILSIELLWNKM